MEVLFLCEQGLKKTRDEEFGQSFAWDLPMLEGYAARVLSIPDWNLKKPATMRLRSPLLPVFRETGATHLWVEGWRFPAFWQAVRQAKRAGLKVWCRGESNDLSPEPTFPKNLIKSVLMGWFFRQVDAFLCIGEANRRLYRKYGVVEPKLHPAPYFVDNGRFSSEARSLWPERGQIRKEWGIKPEAFVILYSGKFISKKRVMDVAKAFRKVCEAGEKECHLLLAGSGTLRSELERELKGLPVTFAGFLNQGEIPRAYAASDVVVLASDWGETWGLSANEALASGVAVILSDQCGCAEDLSSVTREVEVFKMGDVQELAELMGDGRWNMGDGEKARERRRAMMKVMTERFDAQNTILTVEKLLGRRRTPPPGEDRR